ncbi:hypothetical protein RJZ56_008126 [Blastomyces dermatitidis]|uniref:Uncharacterized protein n=1 Tax=[Emmonsia] crescens TaxID=73230 RepID=A0A0G2IYP0_9EURO|nr:hypothetical protein EMCG_04579 [Emmonsia crescens UAMH 3008]
MTEDVGFDLIPCDSADETLIAAAKEEFKAELNAASKASSKEGWVPVKTFGAKCDELFHHGVDLANNAFLARHCGSYLDAPKDTLIISMVSNDRQLPFWKLAPGKVLIFRPVDYELSEEAGFLRYIEGSHKISNMEEATRAQEKGIRVRLDQMLIMDGDSVIRWPKTGGGICILQGVLKKA